MGAGRREVWNRTPNPWIILREIPAARLNALAADGSFVAEVERLAGARQAYLETPGWFTSAHGSAALSGVAYFSMGFGLGKGLPLYAGGLGILAGDFPGHERTGEKLNHLDESVH